MPNIIPTLPLSLSPDVSSEFFSGADTFGLPNPFPATFADWLSLPEDYGAELLHGRIEYKAFPSLEHGRVQRRLARLVDPFDGPLRAHGTTGGWWIGTEVDVIVNGHGVRPDMVGWRRDRHPRKPKKGPNGAIEARPDWIAEVLSEGNRNRDRDLRMKYDIYIGAHIPHYWILDPVGRILLIHYKHPNGYIYVDGGGVKETVVAQPFHNLDLQVGYLFPDDQDDDAEDDEDEDDYGDLHDRVTPVMDHGVPSSPD